MTRSRNLDYRRFLGSMVAAAVNGAMIPRLKTETIEKTKDRALRIYAFPAAFNPLDTFSGPGGSLSMRTPVMLKIALAMHAPVTI
jgi:hypothetical protein